MEFLLKNVGVDEKTFNVVHTYQDIPFTTPIIQHKSVLDYLKIQAIESADLPFVIEISEGLEKQIVSYKDFYTQLLRVAFVLTNTYHIQQNSRVVIIPENTLASVYMILAVMLCGGTAVILNSNEPIERIEQQISKVDSILMIRDRLQINNAVDANAILVASQLLSDVQDREFNFEPHQSAIIMFTTGTTSTSKPIIQMHYSIAVNCEALVRHHRLDNTQRLLCTLPIYHVNGLEFTLFASMLAGSSVVLCDRFDPSIYFKLLDKYKITIASLVPTMVNLLLEEDHQNYDLSRLRYFVTAAAPLSRKVANALWEKCHKKIIQGYGLTETTNFSTLLPIDITDDDYQRVMLNCEIPSVGCEIFGNEVVIMDKNNHMVGDGEEGEICMRGHNLMAGYLENPNANAESFQGGWFHSGDIGKFVTLLSTKQKFLQITGRIKNVIKINGHGVSLDEIDRLILDIKGVQDCVTCIVHDQLDREVPLSFVVKNDHSLKTQCIIDAISKILHQQSLPRKIVFVPDIPRMKNGKINRTHALKALLEFMD